jgi:hypothetical protein
MKVNSSESSAMAMGNPTSEFPETDAHSNPYDLPVFPENSSVFVCSHTRHGSPFSQPLLHHSPTLSLKRPRKNNKSKKKAGENPDQKVFVDSIGDIAIETCSRNLVERSKLARKFQISMSNVISEL